MKEVTCMFAETAGEMLHLVVTSAVRGVLRVTKGSNYRIMILIQFLRQFNIVKAVSGA
jgi:hypothetical protein